MPDKALVVSSIPGVYYFDADQRISYLISSVSRYIMLCYLTEIINIQLGNFSLDNFLPLASIIDAEPENVSFLLNELRVKSFLSEKIISANPLSEGSTEHKSSDRQIY